MRTELPGLRALVSRPTQAVGQASAQPLAANEAEVAINGRKKVESATGEIRGTVPSGRLVRTPSDTAGEVNIRVNNVRP
jgi:hypothetical protein